VPYRAKGDQLSMVDLVIVDLLVDFKGVEPAASD
jgi:hypothetical protein